MYTLLPRIILSTCSLLGIGLLVVSFGFKTDPLPTTDFNLSDHSNNYHFNGKRIDAEAFETTYSKTGDFRFPKLTDDLKTSIERQEGVLDYRSKKAKYNLDGISLERDGLIKTVDILKSLVENPEIDPSRYLDLYQIKGKDNKGSMYFTGYYAPIVKVSRTANKVYKYPFYRMPKEWKGPLPTRAQIDRDSALFDMDLEIAYAANPLDIYFMQVQGSGYVQFEDGTQKLLTFDGTNKKAYRSIGKYMIRKGLTTKDKVSINSIKKYCREHPEDIEKILFANPSYVFFKPTDQPVTGAGLEPLTAGQSIAVDPRFIPLGACLLAKVPKVDAKGNFSHHEWKYLFAQDTGGAIKGSGHVDIYSGIGRAAQKLAGKTHHYGEMWLIYPKDLNTRP